MFRAAQANPFDDVVVKATDENLTQVNWALIIDACDKVAAEENGGKDAVAAMIKRLAHRNANVQLYTLELANALSQNCGIKIHKELASRSFTDALLRLANDRNTHQQVKASILERMTEWSEMFSSNPDLGIMEQAFSRFKSQNPSLQAPSKPFKAQITDQDRRREEEELQMALALSVEKPGSSANQKKQSEPSSSSNNTSNVQDSTPDQAHPAGTTAATVSRVRALYDFEPTERGELRFHKGDIIAVLDAVYKNWWRGSLKGQTGIFPLNYVEKLQDPTPEELEREAQMEAEVFGEIQNVEKLLTLLSTSNVDSNIRDNEEITSLYQSTVAIRPKLIELISKYSQKKDDFTQLNEKFIKARRDYEALLEASMTQQMQGGYGRPPPGPSYSYSSGGGGGPPPQQDPVRYYTPGPQGPPTGQDYGAMPPRDGPAPFYMIPPGQQGGMPPQGGMPLTQQQQQQPPHQVQPQQHQQQGGPHYQQQQQPDYAKPMSPAPGPGPGQGPQGGQQAYAQPLPNIYTQTQRPPVQELPTSSSISSGGQQAQMPSQIQNQNPHRDSYSSYHNPADDELYANPNTIPPQPSHPPPSQPYGGQQYQQQANYNAPAHTSSPPPMHANPDIPAPLQPSHGGQFWRPGTADSSAHPQSAGGYMAYKPPGMRSPGPSGGGGGGGEDPSDFYR